jgi:hypothetical protein
MPPPPPPPPHALSSPEHPADTRKAWRRDITSLVKDELEGWAEDAFISLFDSIPRETSSAKAYWELMFGDKIAEHVAKVTRSRFWLTEIEEDQDIVVPRKEDRERVTEAVREAVQEAATTHVADCAYEDIGKRLLNYKDGDIETSHVRSVIRASELSRSAMVEAHARSITDLIMRYAIEDDDDDDDDGYGDGDGDDMDDVEPEPDSEGEEEEEEEEEDDDDEGDGEDDGEEEEEEDDDDEDVQNDLAELKALAGNVEPQHAKRRRGD